jgi:hypothetical protein
MINRVDFLSKPALKKTLEIWPAKLRAALLLFLIRELDPSIGITSQLMATGIDKADHGAGVCGFSSERSLYETNRARV